MIKCGECGYENMDGLDYCDGCGAKLAAAAGGTAAAPAENKSETTPPAPSADSIDAKATPSLAADAQPDGQTPTSEVPTGDLKKETPETPAPSADTSGGPAPSAEPAAFKAKLSVVRGGRKGQEFPLEDGNNLVGRWDPDSGAFPEVDLEVDDPEARISRKHALIRVSDKVTIEDIGSLNGTFVNRGLRLDPGSPVALKDGDEIIIGKTFFKISLN